MTHTELVQKAREAGLTQHRGSYFKPKMTEKGEMSIYDPKTFVVIPDNISGCCELGLLEWGRVKGYITTKEMYEIRCKLSKKFDIAEANDTNGVTWEQFAEFADN